MQDSETYADMSQHDGLLQEIDTQEAMKLQETRMFVVGDPEYLR